MHSTIERWTTGREQDPQEFLTYFLNFMLDLNQIDLLPAAFQTRDSNVDSIQKILDIMFSLKTQTHICCDLTKQSHYTDNKNQWMLHLGLPSDQSRCSLQQMLNDYFRTEILGNDAFCEHCKSRHSIKKSAKLQKVGQYVLIHINRFDNQQRKKYNAVEINQRIMVTCKDQHLLYKPIAVINHHGQSIRTGHCTVDRLFRNNLFNCNDAEVNRTNAFDQKSAYVVLLERSFQEQEEQNKKVSSRKRKIDAAEFKSPPKKKQKSTSQLPRASSTGTKRTFQIFNDSDLTELSRSVDAFSVKADSVEQIDVEMSSPPKKKPRLCRFEIMNPKLLKEKASLLPSGITKVFLRALHKKIKEKKGQQLTISEFWTLQKSVRQKINQGHVHEWKQKGLQITFAGKDFATKVWTQRDFTHSQSLQKQQTADVSMQRPPHWKPEIQFEVLSLKRRSEKPEGIFWPLVVALKKKKKAVGDQLQVQDIVACYNDPKIIHKPSVKNLSAWIAKNMLVTCDGLDLLSILRQQCFLRQQKQKI